MAWLAGWTYRKTVSITGQTGAGTDYQVDFSVGDGSGGDFNLESHCTSFPNDIQVTDNDQTTTLDYWVEDLTVDPITMWAEVADDLGSNVDICIYYGKSGASTESDIDATFLFGDEFSGSSLDTNKWGELYTPTVSVANSIVSVQRTLSANLARIQGLTSFGTCALRMKSKVSSVAVPSGREWGWAGDTTALPANFEQFEIWSATQQTVSKKAGTIESTTISGISANTFYIYDILFVKNTSAKFYLDGVLKDTDSTQIPNVDLYPFLGVYNTIHTIYADWVAIRKYQVTEPAFSSAGSEESLMSRSYGYIF